MLEAILFSLQVSIVWIMFLNNEFGSELKPFSVSLIYPDGFRPN